METLKFLIVNTIWAVLFICIVYFLTACSTAPAHEPYYEEETYTEECYCKGPPTAEVQIEDQR